MSFLHKIPQQEKKMYLLASLLIIALALLELIMPSGLVLAAVIVLFLALLIFRNPFLGFLAIVFFLPFERLGAYEASLGTIRLSQVFLGITLLAWLFKMMARRRLTFRSFPITLPLVLFLVVNLVGLIYADNLDRSIFVLLITAFTMLIAVLVANLIDDKEKLKKVMVVLLVSATLVSIFGLYQFMGDMVGLAPEVTGLRPHYTKDVLGFTRIQSTALEPLYFANYLLIPLSIIYALFLSRFYQSKKWFLVILIFILGINLFLTISRGGYLGLIASILLITFLYFRSFFTWKKIVILIITITLLYVVGVQFLQIGGGALNWETFISHVRGVFAGPSYLERIDTFEKAFLAFNDHPLFGIGPGGFGPQVATYTHIIPGGGWKIVNNEFIELLTETGILGFIFMMAAFIILFIRSIKAIKITDNNYLKAMMIGLLGAFLGVMVQYQTFSILYIMHIWFLFGLMIACQNLILGTHEKTN
ncbi:MAG: O-antigen ligase family protein [Patescibacteria group bacterium]